jgi:hypothetical protein
MGIVGLKKIKMYFITVGSYFSIFLEVTWGYYQGFWLTQTPQATHQPSDDISQTPEMRSEVVEKCWKAIWKALKAGCPMSSRMLITENLKNLYGVLFSSKTALVFVWYLCILQVESQSLWCVVLVHGILRNFRVPGYLNSAALDVHPTISQKISPLTYCWLLVICILYIPLDPCENPPKKNGNRCEFKNQIKIWRKKRWYNAQCWESPREPWQIPLFHTIALVREWGSPLYNYQTKNIHKTINQLVY